MKPTLLIIAFLFSCVPAFTQWTRITSVPPIHIVSLTVNNNTLYAVSDTNEIYRSSDGGVNWNPIRVNASVNITSLVFYENNMYAGTYNGVYFSTDNGISWQNNGSAPFSISQFAIREAHLYASTLGAGVASMDPVTKRWVLMDGLLPDYSVNVQGIIGTPASLLMAAGSNGTFYTYDANNSRWQEKYYDGVLHPGLQIDKIINNTDTIFAVNGNRIIKSLNNGVSWINDATGTHNGGRRSIYAGSQDHYLITNFIPAGSSIQRRSKEAATGSTWNANEEFLPDGFSFDIMEFQNTLFLARADGLFFKDLNTGSLPVHFSSFTLSCQVPGVLLTWKTVREQHSSHFDIEKSMDGIHWQVSGSVSAAGNSILESSYFFRDNIPVRGNYYRVAAYDLGGQVQYTGILKSSCNVTEAITVWPNPVHDQLFINIISRHGSQVRIMFFDSKGALVHVQNDVIAEGNNQLSVDMRSLAKGVYRLSVWSGNDPLQTTLQVLKE